LNTFAGSLLDRVNTPLRRWVRLFTVTLPAQYIAYTTHEISL